MNGIRVLARDHRLLEADCKNYKRTGVLDARWRTLRLYHVVDGEGKCIDSLCRRPHLKGCGYGRRKEAAAVVREERAALRVPVHF